MTMAKNFSNMSAEISVEAYNYVAEMARLFSNNRVESLYYDYLINQGIEGLNKAITTYEGECKGAKFVTYMHRVVKNHLINEKDRFLRHKLNIQEPVYKGNDDEGDDNELFDKHNAKMATGFSLMSDDVEDDDVEVGSNSYGTIFFVDKKEKELLKSLILKANKGNERNAHIVELHIGFGCEPMDLKDIAKAYDLSHESVRLVYTKTIKALRSNKNATDFLMSMIG